ncbi:MAG TPA: Asp-tRNA(Asn)/Glu-tRNA(Gln) amidotransferase subunit GatC [Candidatus Nanoarchaeia archaeon]|nr:Asp-tRNA(Asn)/Glu-tRNA(Gln) amidotransferase subunit GatC [Candidatus Nanoarchaeia archaeon]
MNISLDLVKKVAANARLKLKEDELKKFVEEMKDILSNFSKLSKVDTANTPPSFHPIPVVNKTREDKTDECLDRDDALSLTPHSKDGYFRGPKVL